MANWNEPGVPKRVRNVNPDLLTSGIKQVGQGASENREPGYYSRELGQVFSSVSSFDHGYLKVRRETDGEAVHLTYTWTITAAAGCYVYVRVNAIDLLEGMTLLAGKIYEVDTGRRKPTPDKRGRYGA